MSFFVLFIKVFERQKKEVNEKHLFIFFIDHRFWSMLAIYGANLPIDVSCCVLDKI